MTIKKGDKFRAKCTGYVWHVEKVGKKGRASISMWTAAKDVGCVSMMFSRTQIKREFVQALEL